MSKLNKIQSETQLQNNCAETTNVVKPECKECAWPSVNELQTMNGKHEYTSTFLYLEQMIKILTRETEELQQQFENQASYTKERDVKITKTTENLIRLDKTIDELKSEQLQVELELQQNDEYFQYAEQLLCSLEADSANCDQASRANKCHFEYAKLLKLLESDDVSQTHFEQIKYEMQDFNKMSALQSIPPQSCKDIISIMNYHTNVLENNQKQLHVLQDKIDKITNAYNDIRHVSKDNNCNKNKPCNVNSI